MIKAVYFLKNGNIDCTLVDVETDDEIFVPFVTETNDEPEKPEE